MPNPSQRTILKKAFTIVELLIAIVVIAILATLSYVAYNGISSAADASRLKSELRSGSEKISMFEADNGRFPTTLDSAPFQDIFSQTEDYRYTYISTNRSYCLSGQSIMNPESIFFVSNRSGQVSDGDCSQRPAVAAGVYHTCILSGDGGVYCWGGNSYGQLGQGDSVDRNAPVLVEGALSGKRVTDLAASYHSTCALADGEVYCWGRNSNGELGVGDNIDRNTPVAIGGPLDNLRVTNIDGALNSFCSVADNRIYCWGANWSGQLAQGDTVSRTTPHLVAGLPYSESEVILSTGWEHVCAGIDESVFCWGTNWYGSLGAGIAMGSGGDRSSPVQVSGLPAGKKVEEIVSGLYYTCVLMEGSVYCWGENYDGMVGDGTTINRNLPQPVLGSIDGLNVARLVSADVFTCAIHEGVSHCWGSGYERFFGETATNNLLPAPAGGVLSGKIITSADNNWSSSRCVLADDNLYCKGPNSYGSGWGDNTERTLPEQLTIPGL